ncbi:hypothetical protein AK88_04279 [Plasmodium fragile]|uniref:Schizont-infected cell agglutination C-terminal domain-containing protein n=1 Tax=Plasmodium fragile TaxID=5857 RepID=A0A0D9QGK5_PLAFR|nr:uncharacterized protein AK88_04279 [Plasmodium fragile]KJP86088.1 hypothetical protein AK88_04279 [Plasmodium fragile]
MSRGSTSSGPWMEILRLYASTKTTGKTINQEETLYGPLCNTGAGVHLEQQENGEHRYEVPMNKEETNACTSMIVALSFANGWHIRGEHTGRSSVSQNTMDDFVRCAIANIFMYKLEELFCVENLGIRYAWYIMENMDAQGMKNLIKDGKCTMNMTGYRKGWNEAEKKKIKGFLQSDEGMFQGIPKTATGTTCTTQVKMQKAQHDKIQVKSANEDNKDAPRPPRPPAGSPGHTGTATTAVGKAGSPPARTSDTSGANSGPGQAAKPGHPAKPAPTKPVAAKPVATKTTITTEEKTCQGQKILEWREREIYVAQQYSDEQWNKVKSVLEEFIQYLKENNENFDDYGANCDNEGWDDFIQGQHHTGQTVADMMRCRLMTGALWFANGANGGGVDDEDTNKLRCEVAHVFGHLLNTLYCKDKKGYKRGIEYAWQAMRSMKSGASGTSGVLGGPVIDGTCTECGYGDNKRNITAINLRIAQWLLEHGKVSSEVAQMQQAMPCTTKWRDYINEDAKRGDPLDDVLTTEGMQAKKRLDKDIVQKAERIFERAKEAVEKKIAELKEAEKTKKTAGTSDKTTAADTGSAPGPTAAGGSPSQGKGVARSEEPAEPPGRPSGTEDKGNRSPPPPEPARPAAPAPSGTSQGEHDVEKILMEIDEQEKERLARISTTGRFEGEDLVNVIRPGDNSSISISTGTSNPTWTIPTGDANPKATIEEPAVPVTTGRTADTVPEPAPQPPAASPAEPTTTTTTSSSAAPGAPAGASEPTPAPAEDSVNNTQIDTPVDTKGDTGPPGPASPSGTAGDDGEAGTNDVDGGSDGGTGEDPPPLNPPKPKPNPNPNQSGSSPSGSSGGTGPGVGGVSGGEGKGGGGGEKAAGGTGSGSAGPGGRSGAGVSGGASGSGAVPGATGAAGVGHGGGGGATGGEPGAGSVDAGPGSTGHQTPGSSGPGSTRTSQPGSSGSVSTGHQPPGSSKPGSDPSTQPNNAQGTGSKPTDPDGGFGLSLDRAPAVGNIGEGYAPATPTEKTSGNGDMNSGAGPDGPDLTADILTATAPVLFFLSAVTVAFLGYSLWKYFAYLAKRRRTYRTVRDVPSPPLDEEILAHLQRGEPPPDYGYTMVRDRRPGRLPAARRRPRPPRVHKRTIIELHLEVLHECEATEWENVKQDYLKIVLQEFAQELIRDDHRNNNILDVSTTTQGLSGNNISATADPPTYSDATNPCPPNEEDPHPWNCMENIQLERDRCTPHAHDPDPWRCMETIQLATDPCPPNDPDPWGCMEPIQLATAPSPPNEEDPDPCSGMETIQLEPQRTPALFPSSSDPRNECPIPDHTNWINWIDRSKHILRECTGQTWFLQLTADWKQYYQQHATDDVSGHIHNGAAATMDRTKLRLWKQWVAQQHQQMCMYGQEEWFKHLLNSVDEETVPETRAVPTVDTDLEVEKAMAAAHVLRVRDVPCTQPLHKQPYMKKPLTANTWILILALVIEQCDVDSRLQETELYVDELLEQL